MSLSDASDKPIGIIPIIQKELFRLDVCHSKLLNAPVACIELTIVATSSTESIQLPFTRKHERLNFGTRNKIKNLYV